MSNVDQLAAAPVESPQPTRFSGAPAVAFMSTGAGARKIRGPMDPGSIGALVPVAAIAAFVVIKVSKIKAQAALGSGPDPQTARRLDAMENELETLRQEMGETQERLDFTERLLAQQREARIDPPRQS